MCASSRLRLLCLALFSAALLPGLAFGQLATISGTVTDGATGDPLAGANIFVVGTTLGTSADADGAYRLTLAPGTYELQATFIGFSAASTSLTVRAGQTLTQNFALAENLIGAGEVVVLGTRRQGRTVVDSPVPVDVLTPAEIQATGFTETTQVLQLLIPSYNAPQASITDGSDHIRPATLRGLGPDQVLVLVNGKRRHTGALVHVNGSVGRGSTGADLNAIPPSAIERIEVLRDGAAAQYGSDAIAGVINIVLKENPGLDVGVTYGQYLSTTTRGYDPDEGFLSDNSDVNAYDWDAPGETGFNRIGAPEEETYTDGQTVQVTAGYGFEVADGTIYASGTLRHRDFVNRAGLDPRQQYYDGFEGGTFSEESFPRLNHRYGNGEFDELSFFLNGSVPINEAGTQLYAFGGVSAREGLSGCFYRRSLDNRTNRALYPNGFLPKINAKVNDYSGAAGIKGTYAGWAFDLSETVGTNALTFDMDDTHNASMDNSPTAFDAGTLNFAQATSNLDLFRSIEIGTAAPLSIAIGGEFRWENYWIDAGDEFSFLDGGVPVRDGPNAGSAAPTGSQCFPGFRPESQQDETRTNVGVYLDLENNLTSRVLLSLAGRFENYSDFGATATGKLAGRFEITPQLALRGAASTGFRAPSLAQAWFTSIATNFIDGVPFEVGTFPVESPVARALGAEDLDPETSFNLSAGVTFQQNNFSLTLDAYQIEIDDRITFTENFTDAAVAQFLAAQGINATGGRYFTNALDTRTQGIDLTGRYGLPLGPGTARLTAALNFSDTEVTNLDLDTDGDGDPDAIAAPAQLAALNQPTLVDRSRVGDYQDAQPDSKINLQVNYDLRDVRLMLRTIRYGEVTSISSSTPLRDQTFAAKWVTDAEVGYALRSGVMIAIGANNLFDVYPEKQFKANSFNGIFPYNGFSPFGFFGRYLYARANVRLF